MFDGLKDKLDSFTKETEEDVEVPDDAAVEEVDGDEAATGEPSDGDVPPEGGEGTAERPAGGSQSEAIQEPAEADAEGAVVGEDGAVGEAPADGEGAADVEKSADGETATDDETAIDGETPAGEDADEDEEESGLGFRERAKIVASGKTVIDEDDLDRHLEELELALLSSDVELDVAQEILASVEENLVGETRRRLSSTDSIVRDALREALYDVISVGQFDFDARIREANKPVVLIFTGVNGVGKTTSIAKLAHYFEKQGLSSVLANGDTYRAGANEQLEQHADALEKRIISHEKGSDPAAVIYDAVEYAEANYVDIVLGDTAGRLHTSDGLMDQLSKIDRVIEPDMTLFVDEAVAGQDAVNRAREFDAAASIDGTILTKADADTQGGAAISISHVTGKPILFLGTGQDYEDLERFDPERIVDQLLGAD